MDISVNQLFQQGILSQRAMNACSRAGLNTAGEIVNYARHSSFADIRGVGARTMLELKSIVERFTDPDSRRALLVESSVLSGTSEESVLDPYRRILSELTPRARELADRRLARIKADLPRRAQHVVAGDDFDHLSAVELALSKNQAPYKQRFVGAATISSLRAAFKDYPAFLIELSCLTETDMYRRTILSRYPFAAARISEITAFHQEHRMTPMLTLLLCYFEVTTDRTMRILSRYAGLGETEPRNPGAISEEFGLSRERIRQIVHARPVSDDLSRLLQDPEWVRYHCIDDPIIVVRERFPLLGMEPGVNSVKRLTSLMLLLGKDLVVADGHQYPVAHELTEVCRFRNAISKMETLRRKRATRPWTVAADKIIDANITTLKSDLKRKAKQALSVIAADAFGIHMEVGKLHIPRNHVDTAAELAEILAEKGQPMTLSQLFLEFKDRFPEHRYTMASQLRPYLTNNPGVVSIGKASTYVTPGWNGCVKTIRELIRQFLRESPVPLSVNRIVELIGKEGRHTTANSVNTSIWTSEKDGFVRFAPNLYGLPDRDYGPEFRPMERPEHRSRTFEERMAEFNDFLDKNRTLPCSTCTNVDESSLYRWYYNVSSGRIDMNRTQRELFHRSCMERAEWIVDNPEHVTRRRVDLVRRHVKHYGHPPTHEENPALHIWLAMHAECCHRNPSRSCQASQLVRELGLA